MMLVNDFPTKEINIQRVLKQWHSLAPFLFLLVAEGLSGLVSRVVEFALLTYFRI